jgi:Sel1 repeat
MYCEKCTSPTWRPPSGLSHATGSRRRREVNLVLRAVHGAEVAIVVVGKAQVRRARNGLLGAIALTVTLGVVWPQIARADIASRGLEAYSRGDYKTALEKLRNIAERGHGPACAVVGRMYLDGSGVAKDATTAAHFFARGADKGDAMAMTYLADLYATGNGVPHDPAQALILWRKAAHLGESFAAHNLGIEYWRGIDVSQDRKLALRWLDVAIANLTKSEERLRSGFVKDRESLAVAMSPDEMDAAALLVSADAPTDGVVFRDRRWVEERATTLCQGSAFRASPLGMLERGEIRGASQLCPRGIFRTGGELSFVTVILVLVRSDGSAGDTVIETASGLSGFDMVLLRTVRAAKMEPRRVHDQAVDSWQVLKWTLHPD